MSIKLNGATSGSIDIDVPAVVGGDVSLELPGGGTVDRLERAGNILQVVSASTSTEVVVSTTTYTDTGLTATITPTSASSKILVIINQSYYVTRSNTGQGAGIRIYRDAVLIDDPQEDSNGPYNAFVSAAGTTLIRVGGMTSRTVLDAPSTTSAVTYKTQGRPYRSDSTGSATFQQALTPTPGTSNIYLIEVAA